MNSASGGGFTLWYPSRPSILRVFLLTFHSYLYSFALRFLFLQTRATSYSFYSSLLYTENEKGRKSEKKLMQPLTVSTVRYCTLLRRKEENLRKNSCNLLQFLQLVTVHCKGERRKTWEKTYPLSYGSRNPNRNLKSEISQDYAQKP
jgi:hypothetical protein